jgi:hypothetical protein
MLAATASFLGLSKLVRAAPALTDIYPACPLPTKPPYWDAAIEYAEKLAAHWAWAAEFNGGLLDQCPETPDLGTICLDTVPLGGSWNVPGTVMGDTPVVYGVDYGIRAGWRNSTIIRDHWEEGLKYNKESAVREMLTLLIRCYDIGHAARIY